MANYNIELKNPIKGLASSIKQKEYNTKTFLLKTIEEENRSFLKINKNKNSKEPWFPLIKKINHYNKIQSSGRIREIFYTSPVYFLQNFYKDNPPLKRAEKIEPHIVDNHTIEVPYKNIYIENLKITKKDNNKFKVPENLIIKDKDNDEQIIPVDWNIYSGRIKTYSKISNRNIYVDYIYRTKYFDYRGYFLDENNFISLNLNTNPGNTYIELNPYDNKSQEIKPNSQDPEGLNNKTVYFYMKPTYIKESLMDLSDDYTFNIKSHPRFKLNYEIDFIKDQEIIETYSETNTISALDEEYTKEGNEILNELNLEIKNYKIKIRNLSPRTLNGKNDIELTFNNNLDSLEVTDEENWHVKAKSIYNKTAKTVELDINNPIREEPLPLFEDFDLKEEELEYDSSKDYEYKLTFGFEGDFETNTDIITPIVEWKISNNQYTHYHNFNNNIEMTDKVVLKLYDKKTSNYIKENYIYYENNNSVFHTINEKIKPSHPFIKDEIESGYYSFDDILYLGQINVTPITNINKLIYKDIRERGGGIKEKYVDEIIKNQTTPPALYDNKPIDGEPYPKNNINIIELPKEILVKNGGYLTEKEVEEKIEKYIAMGNLPIILYK